MKAVGLMSGTSADGIDAALVEVYEANADPKLTLLAFETFSYPPGLRERILRVASNAGTVEEVCHLNFYLGELFAKAALSISNKAGVEIEEVSLIGSHGQTICHLPKPVREGEFEVRSTLQIGEPSIIAERTGILTVADFRPRDIGCGGEGAPLTPYLHFILFRDATKSRVVLNIGGMSNLTYLPVNASLDQVLAFDSGPGNVLIDGLVSRLTGGRLGYDVGGLLALKGRVSSSLLEWLMAHPFLGKAPPKSTGRGEFGAMLIEEVIGRGMALGLSKEDLIATATAFTAASIADQTRRFILPHGQVEELVVTGGGAENQALLKGLQEALLFLRLKSASELGFPGRAVEAAAFAFLAYLTTTGRPGNLPSATGAKKAAILGKLIPGRFWARD